MTDSTTLDLHDLATVLLHEWQETEPNFLHSQLLEVTNGSKPKKALPSHIELPIFNHARRQVSNLRAYFIEDDRIAHPTPVTESDFKHKDFTSAIPFAAPFSETEIETMFWQCKNHDHGYALAHAMQVVLDNLPTTVKHIRIRTSQGHSILVKPTEFAIAEVEVVAKQAFYICQLKKEPGMTESERQLSQYVTGADGPLPWVYLVFGEGSLKKADISLDGRIALDLAAPLLSGMRGLGMEAFAMERTHDYHAKVLPQGGRELPGEVMLSARIVPNSRPHEAKLGLALAKKVMGRVKGIIEADERSCGYCGKKTPKSTCAGCKQAKYCDKRCQTRGWKYHKRWCKVDAAASAEASQGNSG